MDFKKNHIRREMPNFYRDLKVNDRQVVLESIKVNELAAGASFGELALTENKPRTATIICSESCCFAIMEKDNYMKIMAQIEADILHRRVNFLREFDLFKSWTQ